MQLMIAWQKFVCNGGSDLADMAMWPYPAILTAGNLSLQKPRSPSPQSCHIPFKHR